jgi:hypothetical protein
VERPGYRRYQIFLVREFFERFFDDTLTRSTSPYDQAESALLAVDFQRVVDFLLVR